MRVCGRFGPPVWNVRFSPNLPRLGRFRPSLPRGLPSPSKTGRNTSYRVARNAQSIGREAAPGLALRPPDTCVETGTFSEQAGRGPERALRVLVVIGPKMHHIGALGGGDRGRQGVADAPRRACAARGACVADGEGLREGARAVGPLAASTLRVKATRRRPRCRPACRPPPRRCAGTRCRNSGPSAPRPRSGGPGARPPRRWTRCP